MVVNNRKYGITCRSQGNLNLAFCSLPTYQKVKNHIWRCGEKPKINTTRPTQCAIEQMLSLDD